MKAGTRVLIKNANLYTLGIVKHISGDKATVVLDKGQDNTVDVKRLVPILYFDKFLTTSLDAKWLKDHEKLIRPESFDIRDFFLSKKAQLCTVPLLTAMFYWANNYVFESKLTLPKLVTNTRKQGASGIYRPKEHELGVSAKSNVTVKEIFDTLLHEAVHVHQYKVDKVNGDWDPASGAHGKSFKRWAGPLQEIAGVKLTQMHDMDSIEVEDAEDTGKPSLFVLAVHMPGSAKDSYYACKSDKKENVDEAKKAIRAMLGVTAKYYTRTVSNAALTNLVVNCKNTVGVRSTKIGSFYFSSIPVSVFDQILKIGKTPE